MSSNMPTVTLVFGLLLIVLGVGGYLATGAASVTALIPAFFGAVFVILGLVARNERFLKHTMHVAAVLALLGVGGSFSGLTKLPALVSGGEVARPPAVISQATMAILSIVFLVLCVRSFIEARRARDAG